MLSKPFLPFLGVLSSVENELYSKRVTFLIPGILQGILIASRGTSHGMGDAVGIVGAQKKGRRRALATPTPLKAFDH